MADLDPVFCGANATLIMHVPEDFSAWPLHLSDVIVNCPDSLPEREMPLIARGELP